MRRLLQCLRERHMASDRFEKQIGFIVEMDKLKRILRQTILTDHSRQETSAEHSWHLGVMALVLSEYAETGVDLLRVLKMVLVHDLVEIDAGDTYCYDRVETQDQVEREKKAADRLFGLLPEDQAGELRGLWEEFEARKTPEARFAAALDRLQPILQNYHTQGEMWKKNSISSRQVVRRNQPIEDGSPLLWDYVLHLLDDAVKKGMLQT
jgi:putative hydrolase of HD superfamily